MMGRFAYRARRRVAPIVAAGALVVALSAPTTALAADSGNQNNSHWVGGALFYNEGMTARLAIAYNCVPGTTAEITVTLVQSETRHGTSKHPVTCYGFTNILYAEVPSFGEPWQEGHATAYKEITGNSTERSVPFTISMWPGAPRS